MSRRSVDPASATRLALVGAATPEGTHLRDALQDHGLPGDRVDLYGTTEGEALLSEYNGEARLIQELSPDEVATHDVVFLCETGESAHRVLAAATATGPVVIDLIGFCAGRDDVPLVHVDILPVPDDHRGVVAVPHALSSILAEMLLPVQTAAGLTRAHAAVLCPANDYGAEGLEELREQTVRLFNFTEVPTDVFGRQLAFNVVPYRGVGRTHVEERIADEVAGILGVPSGRLTVRMVLVPVFHGHAISLDVEVEREYDLDELSRAYEGDGGITRGDVWTPLEAAGDRQTVVPEIAANGTRSLRMWAVSGETEKIPANQAVRLADRIAGIGLVPSARG
jgi:aspartate-semialdehyde dehydrogenase